MEPDATRVIMNYEKTSFKGHLVWMVCVLFYFYEFLLRTLLGTFQRPITDDLHLSSLRFALLSSTAYLLIYGLMQIPVGTIVERFGLKKAMIFACATCVVSTLGFAYAHSYYIAFFFRTLMGLGSSFGFICLLVAVYDWMPYRNIALYIGLSQFFGTMGPMLAGGPLNALAQASLVTWRSVFIILSIIGIVLTFLIALIVDKNKRNKGTFLILNTQRDVLAGLYKAVKQPQVWAIAIFCAFVYFSLEYLSENECKNFLISKGFSSIFSSYMITLAWLGFAVSSPLCGFISDRISRRKPILLFSGWSTFLALTLIIYFPVNQGVMSLLFLLFGLGVGASSIGIVTMGEQFKSDNVSAGLGFNNAITMLFVSILAPLIGFLLSVVSKTHPFVLIDFQRAFSVLSILTFTAVVIAIFFVRETFGKSTKENVILNFNYGKNKPETTT